MRQGRLRGFTILELLTVLTVVSLVLSLLLPAVQQVRAAAQKSRCASNLRQFGVALQQYHEVHERYPLAFPWALGYRAMHAPHVALLAYLEQSTLYDGINFELFGVMDGSSLPHPGLATANKTHVAVFLCPADGTSVGRIHGTNYRGNTGVGPGAMPTAERVDSGNGFFWGQSPLRAANVIDGLAYTVAFSERNRGSGIPSGQPDRDIGGIQVNQYIAFIRDADWALQWCRVIASGGSFPGPDGREAGGEWLIGRLENTFYKHAQEPNGPIPDVTIPSFTTMTGLVGARSQHHGGVHALMVDGSTHFVSELIDRPIWRALGSRNGREVVDW